MKREEKKAQTRAKIVTTARQIIINEGLFHFNIRKVAQQAQVSPVTMYKYFQDKDELVATVAAEVLQVYGAKALALAKNDQLDFVGKLREFYRQTRQWQASFLTKEELTSEVQTKLWQSISHFPQVLTVAKQYSSQFWQQMIQQGRAEGIITTRVSDLAIRYYADTLVRFMVDPTVELDETTEAEMEELLLRGIGG